MRYALLLLVSSFGCATQPRAAPEENASADARAEPASTTNGARTARPSTRSTGVARIEAGITPESGPHSWGSRSFEVTRAASGPWRVRVHDEMFFQGVGMQPSQAPAPTHRCTAWIDVPDDVAASAELEGLDFVREGVTTAAAAQSALRAWLERSAPPTTDVLGNLAFGRRFEPC